MNEWEQKMNDCDVKNDGNVVANFQFKFCCLLNSIDYPAAIVCVYFFNIETTLS